MNDNIVLMLAGEQRPTLPMWSMGCESEFTIIAIYGQSALNYARVKKQVDLIILDTHDGPEAELEICRRLRDGHTAPLLLLTREPTETFQIRAYEAGVDECIQKPISNELLMAKVNAWLQFSNRSCYNYFPSNSSVNLGLSQQVT